MICHVRDLLQNKPLVIVALTGITVLIINLLLQPGVAHPVVVLSGAALVVFTLTAFRYPIISSVLFIAVFLTIATSDYRLVSSVLLAPVLAGVVAFHGRPALATVVSLCLWAIGVIDPRDFEQSTSAQGIIVWGVFVLAGTLFGWLAGRYQRNHERLVEEWTEDLERHRKALALTLHDSVASSLTATAMRSEALALERADDSALAEELNEIGASVRSAMMETRALMKVLSTNDMDALHTDSASPSTFRAICDMVADRLKSVGLQVEVAELTPVASLRFNARTLRAIADILNEASINAIKYSKPGSTVTILITRRKNTVAISMENEMTTPDADRSILPLTPSAFSSGLGLPSITELATTVDGKVHTENDGRSWTLTLTLPAP